MSVYGSSLWNFSDIACEKFYVAWRKCIRRLFNLLPQTHCELLTTIIDDCPVDVQLHNRFLRFFQSCCSSDNKCVKLCSKLVLCGSRSDVSDSLTYLCCRYHIDREKVVTFRGNLAKYVQVQEDLSIKGGLVHDLLQYNYDNCDDNVKILIDELCVN